MRIDRLGAGKTCSPAAPSTVLPRMHTVSEEPGHTILDEEKESMSIGQGIISKKLRISSLSRLSWIKIGVLLFLIILFTAAGFLVPLEQWRDMIRSAIEAPGGPVSLPLFGLYITAILLMAPLSPFALTAGLLFGVWWGSVIAILSINIGANIAFLISRYLLHDQVARYLQGNDRVRALHDTVRDEGIGMVAMLRINPLVPFNLQNYVYGVINIPLWRYAVGTFLGSAPFTVMLVYFGHTGRRLLMSDAPLASRLIPVLLGLMLFVPLIWHTTRSVQKRLERAKVTKEKDDTSFAENRDRDRSLKDKP